MQEELGKLQDYQLRHRQFPERHLIYFFLNESTGFIAVSSPNTGGNWNMDFMKTTNAGTTWISLPRITFDVGAITTIPRFIFLNENIGYFWTYKRVYKTTNGGINWTLILGPDFLNPSTKIYDLLISRSNQSLIYVAGGTAGLTAGEVGGSYLAKSINEGNSFETIYDGSLNNSDIKNIGFLSLNSDGVLNMAGSGGIGYLANNNVIVFHQIH